MVINAPLIKMRFACFLVGNTYERIPPDQAKLDRTGQHLRVHDWTVYVDVVDGEKDAIASVTFDMGPSFRQRNFTCHCPIEIEQPGNVGTPSKWRFQSRQQTYAQRKIVNITLTGVGGETLTVRYPVRIGTDYEESEIRHFCIHNKRQIELGPVPLPEEARFRLELLLDQGQKDQMEADLRSIQNRVKGANEWKLIPDASNSGQLTVASPVFLGNEGFHTCSAGLEGIQTKTLLARIRVDVNGKTVQHLCKICQNFIKYEEGIDSIFPDTMSQHLKSNRKAVEGSSNRARHTQLASCGTVEELCRCVNPEHSRGYKLNLLDLSNQSGSPSVEFCFVTETSNSSIIGDLIRFAVHFVHNSIRLAKLSPLKEDRTSEEQLAKLFQYVIKDRYLEKSLAKSIEIDACASDSSMVTFPLDTTPDFESSAVFLNEMSLDDDVSSSIPVEFSECEEPSEIFGTWLQCDLVATGSPKQDTQKRKRSRHEQSQDETMSFPGCNSCLGCDIQGSHLFCTEKGPHHATQCPLWARKPFPDSQLLHEAQLVKGPEYSPAVTHFLRDQQRAPATPDVRQTLPKVEDTTKMEGKPTPMKITRTDLSADPCTINHRQFGYILKKLNRTQGNKKEKRQKELLDYFGTRRNDCVEVIVDGRLRPLTVARGGIKITNERHSDPGISSALSLDELEIVLELLGKPKPQDINEGIMELDRYFDEEHNGSFVLVAGIPN